MFVGFILSFMIMPLALQEITLDNCPELTSFELYANRNDDEAILQLWFRLRLLAENMVHSCGEPIKLYPKKRDGTLGMVWYCTKCRSYWSLRRGKELFYRIILHQFISLSGKSFV